MLSEYEYSLGTALDLDLAPHQVSQFHTILEHLTLEGAQNYEKKARQACCAAARNIISLDAQ